jgi:4-hydroxy-3-methylbut-2-en-1-yl diphosphate synthase IspG/GcpE
MERSDRTLEFHSPRREWGRQMETDRHLGSTEDGIGSTALVSLTEGTVGLIEDGIGSTTLSIGSTKDVTRLTT